MPPKDNIPSKNFTGLTYEFYSAVFRVNVENSSLCHVTIYGVTENGVETIDWNDFNDTRHTYVKALSALGFRALPNAPQQIMERGGHYDGLVLTVKPMR